MTQRRQQVDKAAREKTRDKAMALKKTALIARAPARARPAKTGIVRTVHGGVAPSGAGMPRRGRAAMNAPPQLAGCAPALEQRGQSLMEKGEWRPSALMRALAPAGAAKLGEAPNRDDFVVGEAGNVAHDKSMDEWSDKNLSKEKTAMGSRVGRVARPSAPVAIAANAPTLPLLVIALIGFCKGDGAILDGTAPDDLATAANHLNFPGYRPPRACKLDGAEFATGAFVISTFVKHGFMHNFGFRATVVVARIDWSLLML